MALWMLVGSVLLILLLVVPLGAGGVVQRGVTAIAGNRENVRRRATFLRLRRPHVHLSISRNR